MRSRIAALLVSAMGGAASAQEVIEREEIARSGYASIGDFLQRLPEQGGGTNSNVFGGDGQTQLSLRNLGAQRTLILVDGRRWVAGGSGAGEAVDLNSIPSAAVERVEVIKTGDSAVYGSGAIGGVVNIITRQRADGVEASAYGGLSPHGDAQQYDLSVTSGARSERGSMLFSAGWFDQRSVSAGARDWSAHALGYDFSSRAVTQGSSTRIPQGRATIYYAQYSGVRAADVRQCAGTPGFVPSDPAACPRLDDLANYDHTCTTRLCQDLLARYYPNGYNISACSYHSKGAQAPQGCAMTVDLDAAPGSRVTVNNLTVMPDLAYNSATGAFSPGAGTGVDGWREYTSSDAYNFQAANTLVMPSTRISLFSSDDYRISDSARAFFQGSFVNRRSQNALPPLPFDTSSYGITMAADNAYNPFGETIYDARRRLTEYGPRSQGFDLDTVHAVTGLDGALPAEFGPLQGLLWSVSFTYGRTSGATATEGSLDTAGTGAGLGAADLFFIPSGGYVPDARNTLTPAMIAALGGYQGINQGWSQLASVQANVRKTLFSLASSRPVELAAGYEYRAEYGAYSLNPVALSGNDSDYSGVATTGSFHINEVYAELSVPVVDSLDLHGAARVSSYSTFGRQTSFSAGARWQPIRDVTFSGTYSTGFRAPSISEFYGPLTPTAAGVVDPCLNPGSNKALIAQCPSFNCNDTGCGNNQIITNIGGNSHLQPELARIASVALFAEPRFAPRLRVTVSYWSIALSGQIVQLTPQIFFNECYPASIGSTAAPNPVYCSRIPRDPNTGDVAAVDDSLINAGSTSTSGVDFGMSYWLPTAVGRFAARLDSTYLIKFDTADSLLNPISAAGNYDLGAGVATGGLTPRLKFNLGIDYAIDSVGAGLRGRYIGGFDECADAYGMQSGVAPCAEHNPFPVHRVSAQMTFDLYGSYLLKSALGRTTLSAGVRNLLDTAPPVVYDSALSYADPAYDFAGRFVYGRVTHQF